MNKRKVFVNGGTGVMGSFLTKHLLNLGYAVDVSTRHARASDDPDLTYVQGDFLNFRTIQKQLSDKHYDAYH